MQKLVAWAIFLSLPQLYAPSRKFTRENYCLLLLLKSDLFVNVNRSLL